jgi:cobalt/nickel transport system permease protein
MHIPDGFLNDKTNAAMFGVAGVGLAHAFRKIRAEVSEKVAVMKTKFATYPANAGAEVSIESRISKSGQEKMWRMATVGSFVFAAQMINFSINGETSGHLLGGVLAALILGPFEALMVMVVMLTVQAFTFGDGGVVALGANVVNMGLVASVGGYYLFRFFSKKTKNIAVSVSLAAWFSVVFAAIAASFEMAFSGMESLSVFLPTMLEYHIFIGIVEAVITSVAVTVLVKNDFPLKAFEDESNI